jgi:hypothetical protein
VFFLRTRGKVEPSVVHHSVHALQDELRIDLVVSIVHHLKLCIDVGLRDSPGSLSGLDNVEVHIYRGHPVQTRYGVIEFVRD